MEETINIKESWIETKNGIFLILQVGNIRMVEPCVRFNFPFLRMELVVEPPTE